MRTEAELPRSPGPLWDKIFAGDAEPNRATQILNRFKKFHKENPRVWNMFQKFAFEVIKADRKHYSADAIFHRIRWHVDIETQGDSVKLNNDFTSYYARLFAVAYPNHADLFRTRKRTSEERGAEPMDPSVHDAGEPDSEAEAALAQELDMMLKGFA